MKWLYNIFLIFVTCRLNGADVRFSEIAIGPFAEGQTAEVELQNIGETARDLSGWSIWDGEGHFLMISDGIVLESGEVLAFEMPVGALSDRLLAECALYSGTERSLTTLEDYVQWGHRIYQKGRQQSLNKKLAVDKGIWQERLLVFTVFTYEEKKGRSIEVLWDGNRDRVTAGDIVVEDFNQWFLCQPDETSLGRKNDLPLPQLEVSCYYNGASGVPEVLIKVYGLLNTQGIYHIQISRNEEFSDLIKEIRSDQHGWQLNLVDGKYYLRVRKISSDKEGAWTDTKGFFVNTLAKSGTVD